MVFGIIFAITSAIFFGLYVIPKKLVKINPLVYMVFTGAGFFVSSLAAFLISYRVGEVDFGELVEPIMLLAVLEGILWSLGLILLLSAVDKIGVIKANQWKNLQGPLGVLLSLIILAEYQSVNPVIAILAGGAVFISALFFNINTKRAISDHNKNGTSFAVGAALLFGLVAVVNKYMTDEVGVYAQQLIWSLTVFLVSMTIVFSSRVRKMELMGITKMGVLLGLAGGILYFGASYFMLRSYEYIEASIAFTVIQLNFLVVVVLGIVIFREIDLKVHWKRISLGIIFALLGIALLVLAKN